MNIIEKKVRAEIERLKLTNPSEYNYQNADGYIWALDDLLFFLDTLEEEPDESLEEAAEEYEKEHTYQRYDGGGLTPEYDATLAEAFIAGAEWKEEQMMKDAVEGEVIVPIYEGNDVWSAEIKIPGRYEPGDKVKLIILGGDKFKVGDRIIYHGNGYEITGVDGKWYKVKADIPSQIPELEINAISKYNEKDIKRQE